MRPSSIRDADVQPVLDGIRRIVHGLRESSHAAQRHTGLTGAQLFVLRRLRDAEHLSVNELADRTFTHQSSVSTVVSRLVARGFVTRRIDPGDHRRRRLALTRAGRAALAAAPDAAQERLIGAVQAMTPAGRRALGRALQQIGDAMEVVRRPAMFFEESPAAGRRRRS